MMMLSSDSMLNATDNFLLGKASASATARKKRIVLRRLKQFTYKPQTYHHCIAAAGCSGSGRSESKAPDASGSFGKSSNQDASSSSSTPFRRLDGDINREAGMPLTGHDIVGKENKARGVNCSSHGSISVIGRRREMEDRLTVAPTDFPETHDFFGVYDGHGGARVSSACMDQLHRLIGENINEGYFDWESVMKDCFRKMDDEINAEDSAGGLGLGLVVGGGKSPLGTKVRTDGSTALVLVLAREEIVVANCGHSRAVLYRNGMVMPLSWDQKPDRADERRRVEAAGGKVIDMNDGLRVHGILRATRSIGDKELKPYMICEPEVTVTKCNELDNFIIIASDGLWDVVSSEDACEVVKMCLDGQPRQRLKGESTKSPAVAAAMLAELAMAKGSKDNVSVIVVELKNKCPKS
ncbi:unnamed protein product [Rhodiola kirilowii]